MIILVSFVALVLSVARYSRALSYDLIGLPIRAWAEKHPGKIHKLVTCHWCNAYWIALILTCLALGAYSIFTKTWWPMAGLPFAWPAVAYAASWIVDRTVD